MASIRDIVVDCQRPARVARFWASALDGYRVAPYDEAELERLRSIGIHNVEDDPTVLVEPESGAGPRFFFQLVPEHKQTKNRVHLDLHADDVESEIDRLTVLGARVTARYERTIGMVDVEGNEFCLLVH